MPDCEEKKKREADSAFTISTLITAFKPRQVLLSTSKSKMKQKQEKEIKTTISLTSEQRVLIHHSICQFLQLNGYLKTLDKFLRETDIEKDSWKSCSLNLEEICQEHLKMGKNSNTKVPDANKNVYGTNHVASMEAVEGPNENGADGGGKSKATLENYPNGDNAKSKKKSRSVTDMSCHVIGETNLKDTGPTEDTYSVPSEPVKKSKDKKKKNRNESEASDKYLHEKQDNLSVPSEPVKKFKDKKKKRKNESKSSDNNLLETQAEVADISIQKEEAWKEKKGSKKRKMSTSDNDDTGHVEETPFDDCKRRETDNSYLSNGTEEAIKTPKGPDNGVLENDGGKKSEKQNKTKERNRSAEPKSANAFQRVKQDEVEFADERLQDNSYWAKEGADSGYGAKAQEVLGQVRGRGFRHEKTKKKRGTYRGGQIDLQSHSVKFNYDDDEE